MIEIRFSTPIAVTLMLLACPFALAHQGPDPIAHWTFTQRTVLEGSCRARLGPDLVVPSEAQLVTDNSGSALDFNSKTPEVVQSPALAADDESLPSLALTASVWVAIDEAEAEGGIIGVRDGVPADQNAWLLGYDSTHYVAKVRQLTGNHLVLRSRTPYEKGCWAYVVLVYDGETFDLYVNGKLEASSRDGKGAVSYRESPCYVLAGSGKPETPSLRGRIRDASVYDLAARPEWVAHTFEHHRERVTTALPARPDDLVMVVEPYLQYGTTDGMTVMWETTRAGASAIHYGETDECLQRVEVEGLPDVTIHEGRITGLEPATQYFYRVETTSSDGAKLTSGVSTFTTAVEPGTPFAFTVISDTQFNPEVSAKLCRFAWAQRPSFVLHSGDLVDTGVNDSHWTQHFFPGMRPLISYAPLFPVLGNHEQNAVNYFDYMSLPAPEYYYEFRYGDAHFFMIDSNRNVDPKSEQYRWLDEKLSASGAKWKFACHHHPPYSSDEDDYGNLWKTNKSDRGDLRARQLCQLYEEHGVDIVWNGHIHSYERTWPVRDGKATATGDGPIYMIVGGGGGNLETPGPHRPFFQNRVLRDHHYVMVHVNGETLELRSYDLEDRLFDTVTIQK